MNGVAQTMNCEGLEIKIRKCAGAAGHFQIEVRTPWDFYKFGDYASLAEAQDLSRDMINSRSTWRSSSSGDCWRPSVWQSRKCPLGGVREFWRRGPRGTTLSVRQSHGADGYWRMYSENFPIVRGHDDPGIYDTPHEAIGVLEMLAADGMRTALLD